MGPRNYMISRNHAPPQQHSTHIAQGLHHLCCMFLLRQRRKSSQPLSVCKLQVPLPFTLSTLPSSTAAGWVCRWCTCHARPCQRQASSRQRREPRTFTFFCCFQCSWSEGGRSAHLVQVARDFYCAKRKDQLRCPAKTSPAACSPRVFPPHPLQARNRWTI
jgi:hypothetical protein